VEVGLLEFEAVAQKEFSHVVVHRDQNLRVTLHVLERFL
jgi:hypothetical protein